MTIKQEIDRQFDPTDANAAAELAEACANVLKHGARAIWSENHSMRMGRDTGVELGIALTHLAKALGLIRNTLSGKESDELWNKLFAETGLS